MRYYGPLTDILKGARESENIAILQHVLLFSDTFHPGAAIHGVMLIGPHLHAMCHQ